MKKYKEIEEKISYKQKINRYYSLETRCLKALTDEVLSKTSGWQFNKWVFGTFEKRALRPGQVTQSMVSAMTTVKDNTMETDRF